LAITPPGAARRRGEELGAVADDVVAVETNRVPAGELQALLRASSGIRAGRGLEPDASKKTALTGPRPNPLDIAGRVSPSVPGAAEVERPASSNATISPSSMKCASRQRAQARDLGYRVVTTWPLRPRSRRVASARGEDANPSYLIS